MLPLVAVAVAAALSPPLPASASCGGPGLAVPGAATAPPVPVDGVLVSRVRLVPGQQVEVVGAGYADGCDDSVQVVSGGGCSGPREVHEQVVLRRDVRLVVVQGGHAVPLGAGDATGARAEVRWTARLPAGLRPGSAVLEAGGARLLVLVGRPATPR